jgi:hypothetical protein
LRKKKNNLSVESGALFRQQRLFKWQPRNKLTQGKREQKLLKCKMTIEYYVFPNKVASEQASFIVSRAAFIIFPCGSSICLLLILCRRADHEFVILRSKYSAPHPATCEAH